MELLLLLLMLNGKLVMLLQSGGSGTVVAVPAARTFANPNLNPKPHHI